MTVEHEQLHFTAEAASSPQRVAADAMTYEMDAGQSAQLQTMLLAECEKLETAVKANPQDHKVRGRPVDRTQRLASSLAAFSVLLTPCPCLRFPLGNFSVGSRWQVGASSCSSSLCCNKGLRPTRCAPCLIALFVALFRVPFCTIARTCAETQLLSTRMATALRSQLPRILLDFVSLHSRGWWNPTDDCTSVALVLTTNRFRWCAVLETEHRQA